MLDLTPLRKALASLRRAYDRSERAPDDEEVRDAVIQRFEYTYELCWKMLRRRLEMDAASPDDFDRLSFRELIRAGAERGFIADPEPWMRYRELRNLSSHTYDESKAALIRVAAGEFIADAGALERELTRGQTP
jgi:nucleotidyltransferase substrate binding protein (TIGR01987 family)